MRKHVFGKKLSRDTKERSALFKQIAAALITYGRIQTTEAKAKAVRGLIDKLVNWAKDESEAKRRILAGYLPKKTAKKLVNEVAPVFATRMSGFTRIIKMGPRFSDNAPMVIMEWVEREQVLASLPVPSKGRVKRETKTKTKRAAKTKPKTKTRTKERK